MQNLVSRFIKDESGATAIEYGLIAALIAVGIIGAAGALGGNVSGTFTTISDSSTYRIKAASSEAAFFWSKDRAADIWKPQINPNCVKAFKRGLWG